MGDAMKNALTISLNDKSLKYHYCSVSTFYNMIKNQSIWLSDVSKSNDSQELKWFLTKSEEALQQIWDSLISERKQAGYADNPVEVQSLYASIVQALHTETIKCWAFCLSEKRDDLGQWRGYADDGKGLSIGFNQVPFYAPGVEASFKSGSGSSKNADIFQAARFSNVKYGEGGLPDLDPLIRSRLNLSKELQPSVIRDKLITKVEILNAIAPFHKNLGFRDEAEWRFVCIKKCSEVILNDFTGISKNGEKPVIIPSFRPKKWGYIEKNGNLVSHIEFQGKRFEDTISEIVIGPKCKLTELEIKLFFVSCGLFPNIDACDITISKSESSYQ